LFCADFIGCRDASAMIARPGSSSRHAMRDDVPDLLTWHPFHAARWPRAIVHPDEYLGGDRLVLDWDLGPLSAAEKKAAIGAWCARLPGLKDVRGLRLWSRTPQPLFDAACRMSGLESLQIKLTTCTQLDAITALKRLRYLSIGSSTKVATIAPLGRLSGLRLLELENFKLVSDWSPLLALTALESLAVTGSMWSSQDVGPLDRFGRMTWLRSLSVDTTNVASLRPLAGLAGLERLGVGGKLPMAEYAWLAAQLPRTECRWFQPWLDMADAGIGPCKTCGRKTLVMLTGKGARTLCRDCDAAAVQRHAQAFQAVKDEALRARAAGA
jgi:hypothetical protein